MKKQHSAIIFSLGLVLGLTVAFCLGAGEPSSTSPSPAKKDYSRLQFWGYPNSTGIFDPDTGTIYVYDSELRNCYIVRQIGALGNRLQ